MAAWVAACRSKIDRRAGKVTPAATPLPGRRRDGALLAVQNGFIYGIPRKISGWHMGPVARCVFCWGSKWVTPDTARALATRGDFTWRASDAPQGISMVSAAGTMTHAPPPLSENALAKVN